MERKLVMQLLDEIGVISKLNLDDGCIRYEISLNKNECHNHHHLICKISRVN